MIFAFSENVVNDLLEQGIVGLRQREKLLPSTGELLARGTPSIVVFARERRARLDLRDHVFVAEEKRRSAVAVGLLGLALWRTQAAVGNRHGRLSAGRGDGVRRLQHRRQAGANRAGRIRRANLGRQQRGSTHQRRVEFLGVGRSGGGEDQRSDAGRGRRLERVAQRRHRHRNAILVETRNRPLAAGRGHAEDRRDRRTLEPPVGNIRSVRDNSSHDGIKGFRRAFRQLAPSRSRKSPALSRHAGNGELLEIPRLIVLFEASPAGFRLPF